LKIVVKWHEQTRAQLLDWVETLPGQDPERRGLAQLVLDEVTRLLTASSGSPPQARRLGGGEPARYWLRVTNALWVQYMVREDAKTWMTLFRPRIKRVTILELRSVAPGE
jgi:hypothetical protein